MSNPDPLRVSFTLPDQATARHLDKMIARSAGSPDQWLVQLIHQDRLAASQQTSARLSDLLGRIQADASDNPADPNQMDDRGRVVPPRPASARAPRASSAWRTQ